MAISTPKRRVQKTFNFEKSDRTPVNYFAEPTVHGRVAAALGVSPRGDAVMEALGIDFRYVKVNYNGPLLFKEIEGLNVDAVRGNYTRWVPNENGGYEDYCNFPLKGADPEIIASFPVPSPDGFDYEAAAGYAAAMRDYALHAGNPGIADIINTLGILMSVEDALANLATGDEATMQYIDRRMEMPLGMLSRLIEKANGVIDYIWMGEDLGTQIAPLISPKMYRELLRPRHQRYIDLAKSYGLPVMVHTCGASSWVYEDFIEMGVNAVDTLQPEAAGMDPETLKARFGGRLVFHGCISTAGPLAYGTPADVESVVRYTLDTLMPTRGYMLAPCHTIQDNTPAENVLAMYKAAHEHGRYS